MWSPFCTGRQVQPIRLDWWISRLGKTQSLLGIWVFLCSTTMQTWKCAAAVLHLITPRTTLWPTTHWNMEGFRWVKPVMYIHFNSIQYVPILLLSYRFQWSTTKGAVNEALQTHVGVNIQKFKKLKFWSIVSHPPFYVKPNCLHCIAKNRAVPILSKRTVY